MVSKGATPMTRSTRTLGLVALMSVGALLALTATARADLSLMPGLHPGVGIARRVLINRFNHLVQVTQATPEQRVQLQASRDRLLNILEHSRQDGRQLRIAFKQIFAADQLDLGRLQQIRARQELQQRRVGDAMIRALREVHAILTPPQRAALARSIRAGHGRRGLHRPAAQLPTDAPAAPAAPAPAAPPPAAPAPAPAAPAPAAPAAAPAAPAAPAAG
jgi:Spy/CpxP family protein refolding chaperone